MDLPIVGGSDKEKPSEPKPAKKKKAAKPPDERFWKRYSRHHELPLSAVSSIFLHGIGFGLILLVAYKLIDLGRANALDVDAIVINSGGGGSPGGGEGPVTGFNKNEAVDDGSQEKIKPEPIHEKLQVEPAAPTPIAKAPVSTQRQIEEELAAGTKSIEESTDAVTKAREGFLARGNAAKGKGGTGTGGGKGTGNGPGEGSGNAPGKTNLTKQEARRQRWSVIFQVTTGEEYARQLAHFKATVFIPDPERKGKFLQVQNLVRTPARLTQNLSAVAGRMEFVDDRANSISLLTAFWGLKTEPEYVVAFFPAKFEEELLHKERSFRNLSEDQIELTTFNVVPRGYQYDIVVVEQHRRQK